MTEEFCVHRHGPGGKSEGEDLERHTGKSLVQVFGFTGRICGVTLLRGADIPVCPSLELSTETCPWAKLSAGKINLNEAIGEWNRLELNKQAG